MSGPKIHFPTDEEKAAMLKETLSKMRAVRTEYRQAAINGVEALGRLMAALRDNHHTGQPYKLRALLYSMWNGKAVELNETLGLDWVLKRDFCLVLLGFGFEGGDVKFFYRAIEEAFRNAGLWEWFLEEGEEKKT